jgi:F-type H+-transporting ATPase subunit delta
MVNQVVDAAVLGGVKVQIGDDIIDGSVLTRLQDLRLQLAS